MFADFEPALIGVLKTEPRLKKLKAVGSLPAVVDADLLRRYQTDAPAAYVVLRPAVVRDDAFVPKVVVVVLARNAAGVGSARAGDAVDTGAAAFAAVVAQTLHGRRVANSTWAVKEVAPIDDDVFVQCGLAGFELELEGSPILVWDEALTARLDDFLSFHGDIDIPPHASDEQRAGWVATPRVAPPSAQPDAQLDVTLSGA